ncbi:MAG: ROK family protein [Nostocoides sp.]
MPTPPRTSWGDQLRVGVDIGGTKTEVGLVDQAGAVHASVQAPSGYGAATVLDSAAELVAAVLAKAGSRSVGAIGVGIPGFVDSQAGTVRFAANLGIEHCAVAKELSERTGRPVTVSNDIAAAALGAAAISGRADSSIAYLNLGTGIAAASITTGVDRGPVTSRVIEVGHTPIEWGPEAIRCTCGQVGCIESVAGGWALIQTLGHAGTKRLFSDAAETDAVLNEAAARVARAIGLALQMTVILTDADHVLLGGGLTKSGVRLIDGVRTDLRRRAEHSAFLQRLALWDRFSLLPASAKPGVVGAALRDHRDALSSS